MFLKNKGAVDTAGLLRPTRLFTVFFFVLFYNRRPDGLSYVLEHHTLFLKRLLLAGLAGINAFPLYILKYVELEMP